jgi:hypothetical protein
MKILVNLALLGASGAASWSIYLHLWGEPERGFMGGLWLALEHLAAAVACWLLILVALIAGVALGAGDFLPRGGSRYSIAVMIYLGLLFLFVMPFCIAAPASYDGLVRDGGIGMDVWAARLVVFALPLVAIAYLAWLVHAPAIGGETWPVPRLALGAVTVLGIISLALGVTSVAERLIDAARAPERARQAAIWMHDKQLEAVRGRSPADPLSIWAVHTGPSIAPDVREEALRLIAARPLLETELAGMLSSVQYTEVEEALSLVVAVPFTPTPALAGPVRQAVTTLATELRAEAHGVPSYRPSSYVDAFWSARLALVRAAVERMATTAGVDLRDALDAMRSAVAEVDPESKAAKTYPREIAEAGRRIDAALATKK